MIKGLVFSSSPITTPIYIVNTSSSTSHLCNNRCVFAISLITDVSQALSAVWAAHRHRQTSISRDIYHV